MGYTAVEIVDPRAAPPSSGHLNCEQRCLSSGPTAFADLAIAVCGSSRWCTQPSKSFGQKEAIMPALLYREEAHESPREPARSQRKKVLCGVPAEICGSGINLWRVCGPEGVYVGRGQCLGYP